MVKVSASERCGAGYIRSRRVEKSQRQRVEKTQSRRVTKSQSKDSPRRFTSPLNYDRDLQRDTEFCDQIRNLGKIRAGYEIRKRRFVIASPA